MLRNFFGQTSGTNRGTRGSGAKGQVFTLLSTSINGSNITLAAGPGRAGRGGRPTVSSTPLRRNPEWDNLWLWGKQGLTVAGYTLSLQ